MARRFIAGAVCPKCEQMDKIYVESDASEGTGSVAKCAACGYELQQPGDEENQTAEQPVDQAVTLVNFKTPNKND